jgi:hypothetical protein
LAAVTEVVKEPPTHAAPEAVGPAVIVGAPETGVTKIVFVADLVAHGIVLFARTQEIVPEAVEVGVLVTVAEFPVPEKLAGKVQVSDPDPAPAVYV